jgi:trans-AT polyketide synthase/acyltransferase/oxidoreductase domain-containing protein
MMVTFVFPGQGSQSKGMGGTLFDEFKELTAQADQILGYSIKELCLEDPNINLSLTQYTQPALFTVNAFSYLKKITETGKKPDFVAGHSLGEYNALFAAEAFDFGTGLQLVKKRGELMSRATGSGMAAVIGFNEEQVADALQKNGLQSIDIANLNSPFQIVISGPKADIDRAQQIFEVIPEIKMFSPLKTSGAFHSRYMEEAKRQFEVFLSSYEFSTLKISVISNVYARPYQQTDIKRNLTEQITHPVKWTESIRYLMGLGEMEFLEIGTGRVLTGLIQRIKKEAEPLIIQGVETESVRKEDKQTPPAESATMGDISSSVSSHDDQETGKEERESAVEKIKDDAGVSLGKIVNEIMENVQEKAKVLASSTEKTIKKVAAAAQKKQDKPKKGDIKPIQKRGVSKVSPALLGSMEFKKEYHLKYAYLAGGMSRGIASREMVVSLGKAGMMGFFGTEGLKLNEIETAIHSIQKELTRGEPYGLNLFHNFNAPELDEDMVDLFLATGVRVIETNAFLSITPALVKYRTKGLTRNQRGEVIAWNKIIAKVSRPEVAKYFLSPAPEWIVHKLQSENKITVEEAELLKQIPMADDICVKADSGGYTEGGAIFALLPAMIKLRDEMMEMYGYHQKVRVGAAGGIGTPEAAAAAFILGAGFIQTGSINQCTVEAGTSDTVKDLLQQVNVQDTEYAPAGDLFDLGSKVQVLKKGSFFPARANQLYELYRQYNTFHEINEKTRNLIQEKYFKRGFEQVYEEVKAEYPPHEIEKAAQNPKAKMALVFRWYFKRGMQSALSGDEDNKVNFQIYCGPALGALNQWVKGTVLEDWRNRRVAEIGIKLMEEAAQLLNCRNKVARARIVS